MRRDSPASKTALMVAALRARATAADSPMIIDPWAAALAGDEGERVARGYEQGFTHIELWVALRTRFLDDAIIGLLGQGVGQVVILGAGFDTRAARIGGDGVAWFEVDHPSTQADKRQRLDSLAGYPVDAARYVGCDFEAGQDFIERLVDADFDPSAAAVVIWEGVTPYLSEIAIRATVTRIANGMSPDSHLLFDFLPKRIAARDRVGAGHQRNLALVEGLGEPILWGTNDVLPLLYEAGFRWVKTTSFDEIALDLTGTYRREREFRFQQIAHASRGGLNRP